MEVRKIIKLGDATLCVTLPKYWTEQQNVAKGGHVNVVAEEDGSLVLRHSTLSSHETISKKIESTHNLFHKVKSAYIEGCDEIIVPDGISREELISITKRMIALQVMSTNKMKVFVDDSYSQFPSHVQQLHDLVLLQFQSNSFEDTERLLFLCQRIVHKNKRVKKLASLTHIHAIASLLHIAQFYKQKKPYVAMVHNLLKALFSKKEKAHLLLETLFEKLETIHNPTDRMHVEMMLEHIQQLI